MPNAASPPPPPPPLALSVSLVGSQRQHGEINQRQREFGRDWVASMVGDAHIVGHGIGREKSIGIWRQLYRERLLLVGDVQLHRPHLEAAELVGLVNAFDEHHRHIDGGGMVGRDGEPVDLAVAVQGNDLVVQKAAALDGDQRSNLAPKGAGNEDFSHVAGAVAFLVSNQLNPVVVLHLPGDIPAAADPEEGAGAVLTAGIVAGDGVQPIASARGRGEGQTGATVLSHGDSLSVDGSLYQGPFPAGSAVFLHLHVEPLALQRDKSGFRTGERFLFQVNHYQVDCLILAGRSHKAVGVYADVLRGRVDHYLVPAGYSLMVGVLNRRLNGQELGARFIAQLGR